MTDGLAPGGPLVNTEQGKYREIIGGKRRKMAIIQGKYRGNIWEL